MSTWAGAWVVIQVLWSTAAGGSTPAPDAAPDAGRSASIEIIEMPVESAPLIAVHLMFKAGGIHDPPGMEGLAALTGRMVADSGTQERSYAEIVKAIYPLAARIDVTTDREVTVIRGLTHREQLRRFTRILTEHLLKPSFEERDFERHRSQLQSTLTNTLRAGNDELLGLEAIQQAVFSGHPYGHAPEGTVEGLQRITVQDVRRFYERYYTQANLLLGVGGGYQREYLDRLMEDLRGLAPGTPEVLDLPEPLAPEGQVFSLIEKKTRAAGIHLGYPLPVDRSSPDYYALMVANSFLGEHRTFHGRLMQQLRGARGLNYGSYSYIEYWHRPPSTSHPSPGVPRRQQYFSVWLRPVEPQNAHFALRAALYEIQRLVERGMTTEEFELTRGFLISYSKLWAQDVSRRLGFLMDSRYLGTPDYISEIDRRLRDLTVEQVNDALRRHLRWRNYHAVLVTGNAQEIQQALEGQSPSPLRYDSPPPAEVVEADQVIERFEVQPTTVRIMPVDAMFQK